jgi:hypothetical protein
MVKQLVLQSEKLNPSIFIIIKIHVYHARFTMHSIGGPGLYFSLSST